MNSDNENTVTEQQAIDWTTAWREQCPENCRAFLIPGVDLVEVLHEIGVLGKKAAKKAKKKANKLDAQVRGYMAIGAEDPNDKPEEKILIVGTEKVDGIYRDIINGKIDGGATEATINVGGVESSGIYDFTLPCPRECDPNSPLNS
ncbi:hypothetical protein [Aquimarina sp. 2201CG5-10]|uniref:hypothetical protein n=1 Tax=Aquimarina callyspongiae TaxID=3098150 RepID=UPI002AB3573B|nr:hypothetical protein [Aquimarina sp. 2201CG5-10]MDY8138422.1 hypothetical protein [Aquimarina sp. 2201CG5-10]